MNKLTTVAIITSGLIATTATAEQVFNETIIIDGRACIGNACVAGETIGLGPLKLKWSQADLLFEDSSSSTFPDRNWRILINDSAAGGFERFSIQDETSGLIPFTLVGDAPENALWIDNNGKIGLGTSLPGEELHIATTGIPTIRIEDTGASARVWDVEGTATGFSINDNTAATLPFRIEAAAPSFSFFTDFDGDIGLGTPGPAGKLHTKGNGVQLVYFESGDGGPVQVRFRTDSENRRFLATNNADEVKSQIIFGDDEIKFTGATDSGANRWLTIGPSGIVSQGPTCNPGPCDATFDPDTFEVPTIEDHAAYMWENQHLWAVGPTTSDQPFNLTQKAGGMLHELEVAHIYIEELHTRLEDQEIRHAEVTDQLQQQNEQMLLRLQKLEQTVLAE